MTLTEFLLARIAEDEAVANSTVDLTGRDGWWVDGPSLKSSKYWVYATGENFADRPVAEHIARHDPARVLAECEAKRRIVDDLRTTHATKFPRQQASDQNDFTPLAWGIFCSLALPYADHPDYRQEWKP